MTATTPGDERLMRYLDGELTPGESREVERELAASAELRTKRDALLELRDLLRARYELAEEEAEHAFGPLWERVRSALPATPAHAEARPGVWARVRDWLEAYRSHLVTGTLAATAGALVAAVVTARVVAPGTLAALPAAAEVESLEVLGGSGMVFQTPPDKGNGGATVIWITANEPDGDDSDLEPPSRGPIRGFR